jgi:hypothetical protein
LDYRKDIQPWLGEEISLAVTSLDSDRDPDNGIKPGYLLAVKAQDGELAREFLQLSYSQQALSGTSDLIFEQYKGVNLIYKKPLASAKNTNFTSSAVVGDFVLFANSPKVLKDAINNVQVPELNLSNAVAYQEALNTISDKRIAISYVNIPALSAWIANVNAPENPDIKQTLTLALSAKPQGLAIQTALIGVKGEQDKLPALNAPVGALKYTPEVSILTAAGTNLNQLWIDVDQGLAKDSPLQQLVNLALNRLQEPLGVNLPEDIFTWIQGEYALSLVPSANGNLVDWVFVAENSPDATTAIEHLDELATQQKLSVGNLPLLDTSVTAWTKLTTSKTKSRLASFDAQVKGLHTTIGNYTIFATSVEAMAQAISGGDNALLNSDKFRNAITSLPKENDGYFYLDWSQIEPILTEKVPVIRVMELSVKPLFDSLHYLTISSQGSQNGVRRATLFFTLKRSIT